MGRRLDINVGKPIAGDHDRATKRYRGDIGAAQRDPLGRRHTDRFAVECHRDRVEDLQRWVAAALGDAQSVSGGRCLGEGDLVATAMPKIEID